MVDSGGPCILQSLLSVCKNLADRDFAQRASAEGPIQDHERIHVVYEGSAADLCAFTCEPNLGSLCEWKSRKCCGSVVPSIIASLQAMWLGLGECVNTRSARF